MCQSAEFYSSTRAVTGLMTDAGEPLPSEDHLRRRLVGDPLGGSRLQVLERRPRSAHPYEGPGSGRSSRLAELQSVGVDGPINDLGESVVLYAVNMPQRQSKLHGVSSRGA